MNFEASFNSRIGRRIFASVSGFPALPSFGVALAATALAIGSTGCGVGTQLAPENIPVTVAALSGNVHGGQQPVGGATVQLWAVGTTNYGSAATKLGASVTSNPDGTFTLGSYTCPTTTTQTYITATGGNPGLGGTVNNAALVLAAGLGNCGPLAANPTTTFIQVNELTTAATAFAMGQYFTKTYGATSTDSFGTANTTQAQVGIVNAEATIGSLVSTQSGLVNSGTTLTSGGNSVTTTPESAKLSTIANILAACINSDGLSDSPCPTLFGAVVPTGGTTPTDTLQAAVLMSLYPTSNNATGSSTNMATLFGLQTASSPYVGLSAQPADWTVGILYSGSTTTTLQQPYNIAADAQGNIWVASSTTDDVLTELSPTGVPLANISTIGGVALATLTPRNLAIDTNGNVWITTSSSSGYVFEYVPGGTSPTPIAVAKSPYGLAIDGNNNVFIGQESTSSTYQLTEFLAGNLSANYQIKYPLVGETACCSSAANSTINPEYMAFDTSTPANLWMTGGTQNSTATSVYQLSNINTSQCGTPPFSGICTSLTNSSTANTFTAISTGTISEPFGLAAGMLGTTPQMWIANGVASGTGEDTFDLLALNSSTSAVASGAAYGDTTTLNSPKYLVVDGAGTAWTANNKQTSPGSVVAISNTGTVITPNNTGTTPFNVLGYSHAGITTGAGVAVDPSGNLWVANNLAGGTSGSAVFEIVGVATPTVVPVALALKNGTVGQKP